MNQLKVILKRLGSPSVILSLASQIVTVLLIFKVDIDRTAVITVITSVCSILVVLGIVSNPDTKKVGYGDDLYECPCCHEVTAHVQVGDSMVCSCCGCICNNESVSAT